MTESPVVRVGVETEYATASSDGIRECDPCMYMRLSNEAYGYCQDCCEYLCQSCFSCHKSMKVTRAHKFVQGKNLDEIDGSDSKSDKCSKTCGKHRDETMKYYCREHSVIGCSICILLDHRTCSDVIYIPGSTADLLKEVEALQKTLEKHHTESKTILQKVGAKKTSTENACSKAIEDIRRYRTKINNLLNTYEDDLYKQIEKYRGTTMQYLDTIAGVCQNIQGETEYTKEACEVLRQEQKKSDLFVTLKEKEGTFAWMEKKLKGIDIEKSPLKENEPIFRPNRSLMKQIKRSTRLGKVSESENENGSSSAIFASNGNITARIQGDTLLCKITSMAIFPDGTSLVVSDYNNSRIKVFNTKTLSLTHTLEMPKRPWDFAILDNKEIAVTVPMAKKILFAQLDKELSVVREISVEGECYGVARCNLEHLAVTYGDHNELEIITYEGQVVSMISNPAKQPQIFNKPLYVATNAKGDRLYVSNFKDDSVVCLRPDGSVIATYKDNFLSGPMNLTVADDGTLYVCGKLSHNVHKITEGCQKVSVCVEEEELYKSPYSVVHSAKEDKLYVGLLDHTNIQIFQKVKITWKVINMNMVEVEV